MHLEYEKVCSQEQKFAYMIRTFVLHKAFMQKKALLFLLFCIIRLDREGEWGKVENRYRHVVGCG